ncbi:nuclear transport factor 2 family protein [Streptomyces silvisoli]|uniref:Nuclear transport factor 2 family protein n=1 Tax=Streptomyces silvisoli TaxID=3034235 RepID=A0ABT5ZTT2_9ACTN|nr:nuclear transport factor 2 family protein [Streptomyces silvisoli]MDF3293240.1 nuclear transport factor 2 family protein [Streptomyces silvisoli]
MNETPTETVRAFLAAVRRRDTDAAMALVSPSAEANLHPLRVRNGGADDIRALVTSTVNAFPDLRLTERNLLELGDVVVVELKLEGTQAADYLGVVNQEKHIDVDQAWRFTVDTAAITGVDAYWCQNQLYRRLAVKRLDEVAIVGGAA